MILVGIKYFIQRQVYKTMEVLLLLLMLIYLLFAPLLLTLSSNLISLETHRIKRLFSERQSPVACSMTGCLTLLLFFIKTPSNKSCLISRKLVRRSKQQNAVQTPVKYINNPGNTNTTDNPSNRKQHRQLTNRKLLRYS